MLGCLEGVGDLGLRRSSSGGSGGVGSAVVVKRCKKWIAESVVADVFSRVDWDSEIDPTLSFNENVSLLLAKFPEAFRVEAVDAYYNRVKQIVFIAPLIEKILRGEIQCTYRTTPKHGYYYVIHSRFVKAHLKEPQCVIEVYKTEQIDPYKLSEEDAQLAGLTRSEILSWFHQWYGKNLPLMWRNWFNVRKEPPESN